jgi:hypothetical protein
MKGTRRIVAVVAAWLAVGACASPRAGADGRESSATEPVTVQVSNNNWLDIVIYAAQGGNRTRLGSVPTGSTVDLPLPTPFVSRSGIQLIAAPIGARVSFTSEQLTVLPGQTVEFRIENHLAISSVWIW